MNNIAALLPLLPTGAHSPSCPQVYPKPVTAIIGSGGKTTLLWTLAEHFRHEKVLVCTTTRMLPPAPQQYDAFLEQKMPDTVGAPDVLDVPNIAAGITFGGIALTAESKMSAFSPPFFERLVPHFDKVFMEADGSRGLPFKAWAAHEPVVPAAVNLTILVLPVWPDHARVTAEFVHRMPLFCKISGAAPGAMLNPSHLARLITHPEGPLKCAKGRIILFFNKVASAPELAKAQSVIRLLAPQCRGQFHSILAGSAREDRAVLLQAPLSTTQYTISS